MTRRKQSLFSWENRGCEYILENSEYVPGDTNSYNFWGLQVNCSLFYTTILYYNIVRVMCLIVCSF